MNFYDLFSTSLYLYLSDFKNKMEFSLPVLAGSYSIFFGFAVDFGIITVGLGFLAGTLGVFEKAIKLRREYIAMKTDKAKADKIIKELDKEESEDSDKDNGSNI